MHAYLIPYPNTWVYLILFIIECGVVNKIGSRNSTDWACAILARCTHLYEIM